jgi:phosphatidate cytidylyltransferase
MHVLADPVVTRVLIGLGLALGAATIVGRRLRRRAHTDARRASVENLNSRIASWWAMCGVVVASLLVGEIGSVMLFALLSFLALREFLTLTPSRRADHRILVTVFFLCVPLQYLLVAFERHDLFPLLIPVGGLLCLSAGGALAGDTERFTARVAQVHWGLMICVYALSHAPALLMLEIPGYPGQNAKLLLYLLIVVESSDVLQYIWGKRCGRRAVAPAVSPSKTVEGFAGGIASATLLGAALWRLTPFGPLEAGLVSLGVTVAGFAGGLVMSAVKRDHGVKDFGTVIAGHGGVLDRVD